MISCYKTYRNFFVRGLLSVLLFYCVSVNYLFAQQYNFRNYSVAEGLPQSQVYTICEDSRGYIWLGTRGGGITRFDGRTFQSFTEQDGLASNFIRFIIEDKQGRLCIATDAGLSIYDGRRFTNYANQSALLAGPLGCIVQDIKRNYWIGSDTSGVIYWDGKNVKVYSIKDGLPDKRVSTVYEDNNKDIFIGTEQGLTQFQNGKIVKIAALKGRAVRAIKRDKRGRLWVGAFGGGLFCLDGDIVIRYTQKDGLPNDYINCITEDRKGRIWLGTGGAGACYFNEREFVRFTETEGLCSNAIATITEDIQGNIWLGSSGGGISCFDGERFVHFHQKTALLGNLSFAISQDREGNMWFGSSMGGVTKYDGSYYKLMQEHSGFTNHKVKCIYNAADGRIWFGTVGDGAYVYDGHSFTHYNEKNGLSGLYINAITEDKEGNLWFATAGAGVSILLKNGKSIHFIKIRERDGLINNRINALCLDSDGGMCLGTVAGLCKMKSIGDNHYSFTNYTTHNGLSNNIIRSIVIDNRNRLWMATGGGGLCYIEGGKFKHFTKNDGLCSDNLYSLVLDKKGQLWVGSEKGMDVLNLSDNSKIKLLRHFGRSEGFKGIEVLQNATYCDREGHVWIGTVDGTTRYDPEADTVNLLSPRTHITSLRLFYDDISKTVWRDSNAKWYPLPKQLILPYQQNQLRFDFIGINLRDPEAVRYKWKLEGFDKDWSPAEVDNFATYSNLPPGKYVFKVMSANEDGVWNKDPDRFTFEILPPFWATWWFRLIIGAVTGLMLYSFYYFRVRQLKRRNDAERQKIILQKNIVELEQQALQLQMNPHFIFNALNSISAFVGRNDTIEARRYLSKFAGLMRLTLQNAREAYIPLEDELKLLRNYLDLELLCHNQSFTYTFDIDPDAMDLLVPPMMLQPFLENAILHGILPKKGDGLIVLKIKKEADYIGVEILDNGIGIDASLLKKGITNDGHNSLAYELARKRLLLLKEKDGRPAEITVEDRLLYGYEGTIVKIKMPYEEG